MGASPEERARKVFYFDLLTAELKSRNLHKSAYSMIKRFMLTQGFEHRQYSVYRSVNPMTAIEASRVLVALQNKHPWFADCLKDVEIDDVNESIHGKAIVDDVAMEQRRDARDNRPQINHHKAGPNLDAKIEQVIGQYQTRENSKHLTSDRSTPER